MYGGGVRRSASDKERRLATEHAPQTGACGRRVRSDPQPPLRRTRRTPTDSQRSTQVCRGQVESAHRRSGLARSDAGTIRPCRPVKQRAPAASSAPRSRATPSASRCATAWPASGAPEARSRRRPAIPREQVQTSGRSSTYVRVSDGGVERTFHFSECGATVFSRTTTRRDLVAMTIGAFADPSFPQPVFSVWERRRYPWLPAPEGMAHRTEVGRGWSGADWTGADWRQADPR